MKNFILFYLLVCLISCKNNTIDRPEKPDNLISKEKMAEVIYDMALINSAKGINRTTLENKGIQPKEFIFEKHNIDSIQFAQSNAYYAFDLTEYNNIYEKVKIKLEADKNFFSAELAEERKKRDSLAKLIKERDSLEKLIRSGDSIIEQKQKKSPAVLKPEMQKNPLKKDSTFL